MRNFKSNNRRDFSGRSGGFGNRNRSSGRPEMFNVTCSKCGRDCQVPFKPTGSKPVYCDECFKRSGNEPNSFNSRNTSQPSSNEFAQINAKLDKIIAIMESLELDIDENEENSNSDDEDEDLDEDLDEENDDLEEDMDEEEDMNDTLSDNDEDDEELDEDEEKNI